MWNTKTPVNERTQASALIKFKVVDRNNNTLETFESKKGAKEYAKHHGGTVKPI